MSSVGCVWGVCGGVLGVIMAVWLEVANFPFWDGWRVTAVPGGEGRGKFYVGLLDVED